MLLSGAAGLLFFSINTVPAFAVSSSSPPPNCSTDLPFLPEEISLPRNPAPPPDGYLDIPFLPEDSGLNKAMKTVDEHGVKPFVKFFGDFLANPVGGKSQAADWFHLLVFGTNLDLDRLIGWKGGEFTISGIHAGGDDITRNIGTKFIPAQAVTPRGAALFSLYFTQHLADDKVEFRIGRMTTGSTPYASLPLMGLAVNTAVDGNPLSLGYNTVGFHATGNATWAANIKIKPTDETYIQSGIFQVTHSGNRPYDHGVDFSFRPGDGFLMMAEVGWCPTFLRDTCSSEDCPEKSVVQDPPFAGLPGIYQFGGYYQNDPMPTFLGTHSVQNAYGFYYEGQQMIWRSRLHPKHHFSIWGGLTYSPQKEIALLPIMTYGGVNWAGLIPTRDDDQLLLNYYMGRYSHDYSESNIRSGKGGNTMETTLELSYIFQLTRQIQFQPDLQYFIQPGGSKSISNALVLGFQVSFIY